MSIGSNIVTATVNLNGHSDESEYNILTGLELTNPDPEVAEAIEATEEDLAPLPIERKAIEPPPFPIDVIRPLVPAFADICRVLAYQMQVPSDLPGSMGLSILSMALMGNTTVEIARGQYCEAMVWTFTVLESGLKKTPVCDILKRPVQEWERRHSQELKASIGRDAIERRAAKRQIEQLEKELDKLEPGDPKQDQINNRLLSLVERLEQPAKKAPRYLVSDTTPEALARVLADNEGQITVLDDEGTFLQALAGRYAKSENYGLVLNAWSGSPYVLDRVQDRLHLYIPAVRMVLGITAQPTILRALLDNPAAVEVGFVPRFLISYPADNRGSRRYTNDQPIADGVLEGWHNLVSDMLTNARQRKLGQHPDNWRRLAELHAQYEPELAKEGSLRMIAAWMDKTLTGQGQVMRLAATLHVASGAHGDQIQPATLEAAIAIAEYYCKHAQKAFDLKMQDEVTTVATEMLRIIKRDKLDYVDLSYFDNKVSILRKMRTAERRELRTQSIARLIECRIVVDWHVVTKQGKKLPKLKVSPYLQKHDDQRGGRFA